MDPVVMLPEEVVNLIWIRLKPEDLLACRAVATHWQDSVTSCHKAWVTDHSHSWQDYVEFKKTLRRWRFNKHRTHSYYRVKGCVSNENAFYLLFLDGRLEMHSSCGSLVRVYENKAFDFFEGDNYLMIVEERHTKSGGSAFDTVITDLVLNEIEKWTGVQVLAASHNGFTFIRNGSWYFKSNGCQSEVPVLPNSQLHFLDSFVVSSRCTSGNTISLTYYDVEEPNPSFKLLEEVSGTNVIPNYNILVGPKNFFVVNRTTDKKLYWRSNTVGYLYDSFYFFTDNYFITHTNRYSAFPFCPGNGLVFKLKDFDEPLCDLDENDYYGSTLQSLYTNMTLWCGQDGFANVITSNPFLQNCVVRFRNEYGRRVYEQGELVMITTMVVCEILTFPENHKKDDTVKVLEFSRVPTPAMSLVGSNFFPSYSLKIRERVPTGSSPEKIVHLVHFDL